MSYRPTLSFQLRPTQKLSTPLGKISGLILSMAFLFAIPWLQIVPKEDSFLVNGKLRIPEEKDQIALSGVKIFAYRDLNQDGKIGQLDLLLGQTTTNESGEFLFHIEEGQSYVTHIQEEDDDAWEAEASGHETFLSVDRIPSSLAQGRASLLSGLRFREVHIPSNAIITAAVIQLSASRDVLIPQSFSIFAEQSSKPLPFGVNPKDLRERTRSLSHKEWRFLSLESGEKYQSPDISPLINELIQQKEWSSGQPMVFLIEGDTWLLHSRDSKGHGARLVIHYTIPDQPLILMVDSTSLRPRVDFLPLYLPRSKDSSIVWHGRSQKSMSKMNGISVQLESKDSPLSLSIDQSTGNESLTLHYRAHYTEGVQLEVINMAGQIFQQLPVQGSSEVQTLTLWTTFWPKGLYYLRLYHEDSSIMKPYVVK